MYPEGIYVIGFFYPVVDTGLARIRVQLSAGQEKEHIEKAIVAFNRAAKKYDVLHKSRDEVIARYGL